MTDSLPSYRFEVDAEATGKRLDVFLAARFPEHSRVRLRGAITEGLVRLDGQRAKPSFRLREGQQIELTLPELPKEGPEPEAIPLDIIYEDDCLAVVNKPTGMVVHPAKGHWAGTLTAALAYHFQNLSTVGGPTRPGIVHRLDRETSGVIVIAKTDDAHAHLAKQFEQRLTKKHYLALVIGKMERDRDRIEQPIGAHPYQREKMAIRADHPTSRSAETFYEVAERHGRISLLNVSPRTGRTHQIRLHLAHIGCPVLCDRLYGGRSRITVGELYGKTDGGKSDETPVVLTRLALHAHKLSFTHPQTGEPMEHIAPLAGDIEEVLRLLRGEA